MTRLSVEHRRVTIAMQSLARAKDEFNRAIREEVAAGRSTKDIAGELGVSRSRAWEMIRQADGRGRSKRGKK